MINGINGGMLMLAAVMKRTRFNLRASAEGMPTISWKPQIGKMPIKNPKPMDKALRQLLSSGRWNSAFNMRTKPPLKSKCFGQYQSNATVTK